MLYITKKLKWEEEILIFLQCYLFSPLIIQQKFIHFTYLLVKSLGVLIYLDL